jgi:hypothetical protein
MMAPFRKKRDSFQRGAVKVFGNYSANPQIPGTQSRFPSENQVMSPEFTEIHQYTVLFYSR